MGGARLLGNDRRDLEVCLDEIREMCNFGSSVVGLTSHAQAITWVSRLPKAFCG